MDNHNMKKKIKKSLPVFFLMAIIVLVVGLIYAIKNNEKQGDTIIYPKGGSASPTIAPPVIDTSGQEEVLAPPAPPAD